MTILEASLNLYEIGGALRRNNRIDLAQRIEAVADEIYPEAIKPAPIVPRSTS